jgi:predicted enzyme related to lactoylglutathione lyase
MDNKQPTYRNGKLCYIEIPAVDVNVSASFYKETFGWNMRSHGDGTISFDDTVSEVSRTWVVKRSPSTELGILTYIMVDDINKSMEAVIVNGGTIIQPVGKDAPEITARFTDPAGNVFGLYQQPNE